MKLNLYIIILTYLQGIPPIQESIAKDKDRVPRYKEKVKRAKVGVCVCMGRGEILPIYPAGPKGGQEEGMSV